MMGALQVEVDRSRRSTERRRANAKRAIIKSRLMGRHRQPVPSYPHPIIMIRKYAPSIQSVGRGADTLRSPRAENYASVNSNSPTFEYKRTVRNLEKRKENNGNENNNKKKSGIITSKVERIRWRWGGRDAGGASPVPGPWPSCCTCDPRRPTGDEETTIGCCHLRCWRYRPSSSWPSNSVSVAAYSAGSAAAGSPCSAGHT